MDKKNQKGKNQSKIGKGFHIDSTGAQTSKSIAVVTENSPFTKDELEFIYKLLGKTEVTPSTPSTSYAFAQSGTTKPIMCITSVLNNIPWIVDSRARDHMTQESKLFNSYMPCSGKQKVLMAKGSNIPVHGKGRIAINKDITLDSVLHVPKMSVNLLSISKLTKSQNCLVMFFSNQCVFQDLTMGKTISNVEEREGLYYLIPQDWEN